MAKENTSEYPELIAGKVDHRTKAVVKAVMERAKWTESQLLRQLVHLDRDTIKHLREAWREQRAA